MSALPRTARFLVLLSLMISTLAPSLVAQRRRDPLTPDEIDKLREAAIFPDARLKLWVEFTRARITAVDQLRGDPKMAADRGQRLHDLLEDIGNMVDEIDDNMGNYTRDHWDVRKELKAIIELDTELQAKLRGIKEATDAASEADSRDYRFVLQNTIETVNGNAEDARQMLDDENQLAKDKKLRKPDTMEHPH